MLSWLELPLILAMLVVFSTGIAMLLSALFVSLRDIQPIWEVSQPDPVLLLAGDHPRRNGARKAAAPRATAVLDAKLFHIYMLNPLAVIFQQFRHAMINHATLSAGAALGSWAALLAPLAIVVAIFVLGFWVFNRSAPLVAENL